jgi:sugar phosphate isomerase/epimerase
MKGSWEMTREERKDARERFDEDRLDPCAHCPYGDQCVPDPDEQELCKLEQEEE